ncbi:hypothetical protein MTO96_034752 [Rhipicephalus appendiculatus]
MESLGIRYRTEQGQKVAQNKVRKIRQTLRVDLIPRNVHPEHNRGRRVARARALLHTYGDEMETRFVDAAEYAERS